jgi:hypothetical protein
MKKISLTLFMTFYAFVACLAQTDSTKDINLDDLIGSDPITEKVFANNAFKSSRVIMGQSMEMLGAGVLDSRILHRFGTVQNGFSDVFGLDNAKMRIGFDYGVSKNLTIGVGKRIRWFCKISFFASTYWQKSNTIFPNLLWRNHE